MTDKAQECLVQWAKRAHGFHTPTWAKWQEDTAQALAEHRAKCAQVATLVQAARYAMLDHDLHTIDTNLAELERLFQ